MVEYKLATQEQKEYAELAAQIVRDMLPLDRIHELETADNGLGQYPMDVHMALAEAGFCGLNIPEEYGGIGMDTISIALIIEEMSKVDTGFAFSFYNASSMFALAQRTHIPEADKKALAERMIAGQSITTFALTEPNAGSDAGAMRTTAVYDADTHEWILNGTKCFISNATTADVFFVAAWTDKSKRAGEGVTFFMVEKDRGIKIGKKEAKLGIKLSETAEIILEDVRVPEDHIVGELGKGFSAAVGFLHNEARIFDAIGSLGVAQAALDAAIEYAKNRRQFGKRIIDHQGLAFLIADMQIRTEAARSLLYYTLQTMAAGENPGHLSSSVKTFVTDTTMQTVVDAVQVFGGYGYMKDYPVEKYLRDAKIFQIFGGTGQMLRKDVAKDLAGKDPEIKK